MTNHKVKPLLVTMTLLILSVSAWASEFSPEGAKRIDDFLARIARRRNPSIFLKKMTFNELELNSYMNLIYIKKYAPEVSFIQLSVKPKNQVSGTLKLQLKEKQYEQVPAFLRDVEVRFAGQIECANYRMRFLFQQLVINGSQFSPEIVDEAFALAQPGGKAKRSIYDWFSFLPGLKSIQTGDKSISLLY